MTEPAPTPPTAGTPGAAPASAAAAAAAPVPGSDVPTILSTLHALLRAHVAAHPSPTLPYLHAYAPAPLPIRAWKGKARDDSGEAGAGGAAGGEKGATGGSGATDAAEEQVARLRAMREAMEGARGVLGRPAGDKDKIRVARAMREVINHEAVLQSVGTIVAGLPPAPRPVGDICALPPTSLIEALGKRLGLQVFTEDSQFGLLRMALTLAGARFVVDVDLETDAALGDKTEPPSVAGTPQPSAESVPLVVPLEQRGLVRLAKISANHVTPSGDAGKAEYIASVLRVALESHLELWNASHGARTAELETSTRALEATLAELKTLDELAEAASATDADVFADLESLAAGVAGIADDDAQSAHGYRVYPDTQAALFPSFRLLKAPAGVRNPAFRIRPAARGEHVPFIPDEVVQQAAVPAGTEAGAEGAQSAQSAQTGAPDASEPMAVDSEPKPTTTTDGANTTNTTPMCAGRWLLEYVHDVPLPSAAGRGLVVRRTWLIPGDEEAEASAWSPSIKVEGLLTQAVLEAEGTLSAPIFPLATEFVHHKSSSWPTQHWRLSGPGPEGYVVGRIGLPSSWADFGRFVGALRDQLVLDVLFMTAFPPAAQVSVNTVNAGGVDGADADDDVDMDADDLAELEKHIAITATLYQRRMRVALARDGGTTVLELSPSAAPPYVVVSVPAATAATAASAGTASVGTASAGDAAVERQGQEPQAAAGEVSSGVTAGAGAAAECVARVLDGVGDDADAGLELDAAAIVGRVLAALAQ